MLTQRMMGSEKGTEPQTGHAPTVSAPAGQRGITRRDALDQ